MPDIQDLLKQLKSTVQNAREARTGRKAGEPEVSNIDMFAEAQKSLTASYIAIQGMIDEHFRSSDAFKNADPHLLAVAFLAGEAARDFDIMRRTQNDCRQGWGMLNQLMFPEAYRLSIFCERLTRPLSKKFGEAKMARQNKRGDMLENNFISLDENEEEEGNREIN